MPRKYRNSVRVACKYWTCNGAGFLSSIIAAELLMAAGSHYAIAMIAGAVVQATIATPLNTLWTFKTSSGLAPIIVAMILRGAAVDMVGLLGNEVLVALQIEILARAWWDWFGNFFFARAVSVALLGYPLYLFDLWYTYKIPIANLPPIVALRSLFIR